MPLKPGTTTGIGERFSQSMAEEMEIAFRAELGKHEFSDPHLRMLFVAISRGVVEHLRKNPDAFKVEVNVPSGSGTGSGEVTSIETSIDTE